MDVTKKSEELVEKLADVMCDRCGKSCWDKEHMNIEYAEMKAMWGYGSGHDCERHKIQLCEKCYDEMVKVMEIKVQISHYM
jgi:hypothetical protein